tara:strand:+ start:2068 stop:3120 length:1053 start_codon:yes stop_codon:yes gene_type:complete
MANEVEKLNGIAIADIETINGKTDTNIQAFNGKEFTGVIPYSGVTWTTGGTEAYREGQGGTGISTAFIIVGGTTDAGNQNTTREYNGSSWSAGGNIEAIISSTRVAGSDTAAMYAGGWDATAGVTEYTSRHETYNGTSWSDATSMTRGQSNTGAGTSTSNYIHPCGDIGSPSAGWGTDLTNQLWNGSSWSDGSDVGSLQKNGGTVGSTTDCILISGNNGSDEIKSCQELDGTTWSSGTDNLIQSQYNSSWGTGTTQAWITGGINYQSPYGSPTPHIVFEETNYWNGTSWATDTDNPNSDGIMNMNNGAGLNAATGTQGGLIQGGKSYQGTGSYQFPEPFTKLNTTYEATW